MIHIKKLNELFESNEVMYRYEQSMDSETDPVDVIAFEMGELGNIDIPDYCVKHYGDKMNPVVLEKLQNAIEVIENGDADKSYARDIAETLVSEMEKIWHIRIVRVVWLADYDTVVDLYCDGDEEDIKAVETSDYILSDLSGDGILFAYDK